MSSLLTRGIYMFVAVAIVTAIGFSIPVLVQSSSAGNEKVVVCHIPPGNLSNAHTIKVSENALDAHLAHGDSMGSCSCPCWETFEQLVTATAECENSPIPSCNCSITDNLVVIEDPIMRVVAGTAVDPDPTDLPDSCTFTGFGTVFFDNPVAQADCRAQLIERCDQLGL